MCFNQMSLSLISSCLWPVSPSPLSQFLCWVKWHCAETKPVAADFLCACLPGLLCEGNHDSNSPLGTFPFDSPGPISSILVNKYGSRPIMIVGGCLSGCGLIAASFCNTVEELYFCVGVVGGKCQLCSNGIAAEKPFSEEQLLSSNS